MIISNLSKEDLIEMAMNLKAAIVVLEEEDLSSLCLEFDRNFSHPSASNLFFYPQDYNARRCRNNEESYDPNPEEVVNIAISHQPIQL